ncbi:hypothetical protein CVT24_002726 [Panaeolus cyanescens]|uniref:Uncharacterized protein n=1 Tax=Panaeolus cyanescens TaxID=181874 RepID=A0A409X1S6_9AGAR|nr:hypothetical protein CVT24_002726 [Panaeolus cyanescens]
MDLYITLQHKHRIGGSGRFSHIRESSVFQTVSTHLIYPTPSPIRLPHLSFYLRFHSSLIPRLKRYALSTSPSWQSSLTKAYSAFHQSQLKVHSPIDTPSLPSSPQPHTHIHTPKPRIGLETPQQRDLADKKRAEALKDHLCRRRNVFGVELLWCVAQLIEVVPAFEEVDDEGLIALMMGDGGDGDDVGVGSVDGSAGGSAGAGGKTNAVQLTKSEMRWVHETTQCAVDFIGMAMVNLHTHLPLCGFSNPVFYSRTHYHSDTSN